MNKKQDDMIRREFTDTIGEIDRMIKQASKLLSQMTQYTSIITTPQLKKTTLKHIQLIKIKPSIVLAIIITDAGIVKNSVLQPLGEITTEILR